MMLTASSVRFLVKHIFWIFTKQSDKPFSAYANRWASLERDIKLMPSEIKDIQTLKKEFDEVPSSDNLAFVNFYERNSHSVESININKDQGHYNAKSRLVSEYGISLFGSGQYTKAVKVLSEAIPMFENAPNQNKSELKNISYFEHLLWSYAVSLFETKDLNESIKQFERLVAYKPENDKYRKWLKAIKGQKISNLIKPLWVFMFAWLIGEFTFFENFGPEWHYKL
jgi:tetratricopeptide (TPR) repeat protein